MEVHWDNITFLAKRRVVRIQILGEFEGGLDQSCNLLSQRPNIKRRGSLGIWRRVTLRMKTRTWSQKEEMGVQDQNLCARDGLDVLHCGHRLELGLDLSSRKGLCARCSIFS